MSLRGFLLIAAGFAVYYGFDGVVTNQEIVKYTVDEIENNGIGSDRYIEILDGYAPGNYVYEYSSENSAKEIIFPLVSLKQVDKSIQHVSVIVKRSHDKFERNCVIDNTCIDDVINKQNDKGYVVKGKTLVGFDNIDRETKDLLNSSELNISPDVIFIEEGSKPRDSNTSILMLLGGIIGLVIANPIKVLKEF